MLDGVSKIKSWKRGGERDFRKKKISLKVTFFRDKKPFFLIFSRDSKPLVTILATTNTTKRERAFAKRMGAKTRGSFKNVGSSKTRGAFAKRMEAITRVNNPNFNPDFDHKHKNDF